ncbi:MAG: DUF1232 domain-containing protein [Elainellaceae cyanobacterium]
MKFLIQPLYKLYRTVLRHPKYRWWVILGSLLYLVGPIDISPDVLPIIGWIDDGMVATLLISEVSQILLDRRKTQKESATRADVAPNASKTPIEVDAVVVGKAA